VKFPRGWYYRLTEMGRDLRDVCDAMGKWGARWLEIEPHHVDAAYVLWATTKLVDADLLPDRTVVVRFELRDSPDGYWLLLRKPVPELCTRGDRVRRETWFWLVLSSSATSSSFRKRRLGSSVMTPF